jgi:hypothetical protein
MPSRERHLEFDEILRYKGVICDDIDGNSVHARMDKGSKWYAELHRELDYFHSVNGIRDRVDHVINSIGNIYPSTAADHVRIAYGHLCLDHMASKLKEKFECSYNELYDPLDFLAEVTQHIPNKGEHQIRYYGWYSNKKRGMREDKKTGAVGGQAEPDTPFLRTCRMTWAALIKAVYEVDPLKCPKCGGEMKIVGFIEESLVIEKILRHCNLWKEPAPRPPPAKTMGSPVAVGPTLDYAFFARNCV